jgi:exodeoxyribonuclease V alpha subunit
MNLDASQCAAVERATSTPISLITGGAGTGKTTIIKAISDTLESRGETVALAAFAGKAAARVREACQHPASTIHRMLQFDGRVFARGPLADVSVILDESSMIDAQLMAEIVTRRPRRLVMVGDPAQLPPVGRAQPFHDILALRPDLATTLTTCYRATEAVFSAASAIRGGGRPPMQATSPGESWYMEQTGNPKRTQAHILDLVRGDAFDFSQDIILVARNGESDDDPATVRGLNRAIVDLISPRDWNGKMKWRAGDRVINTKNLPAVDCWNGTTGTVHSIDIDGGLWIETDIPMIDWRKTTNESKPVYTSHVLFGKDIRKNLQLAYALTVHKYQGSQARNVLFAAFERDLRCILDRSLLYTAVTRTKCACAVVGEMAAVWGAIDRVKSKVTVMQKLAEGDE